MAGSKNLADIFQDILNNVEPPQGFEAYQARLKSIRPTGPKLSIKESPENHRPLDDIEGLREVTVAVMDKG